MRGGSLVFSLPLIIKISVMMQTTERYLNGFLFTMRSIQWIGIISNVMNVN
jgi:hypothetical protein